MKIKSLIIGCVAIAIIGVVAFWAVRQNAGPNYKELTEEEADKRAKELSKAFAKYGDQVKITWDRRFLYVESNGVPKHEMMTGITNWNQQVPLPKAYKGRNSFKIPLSPIRNATVQPTTSKGPIAVASNGVPIFNPTTGNGRDDPKQLGELDGHGGHAGKGDDYHYHTAPLFLNKGKPSLPIGYGLDGYPIYGEKETDGTPHKKLDSAHGHDDANGDYHYHGTRSYPYVMGGFKGAVNLRNQPRGAPIRDAGRPIKVKILEFKTIAKNKYYIKYSADDRTYTIDYQVNDDGSYTFEFVDDHGQRSKESYRARRR